jgi:16S rRNA (cytosine967-C5)-methyltransferase
MTPAARAQAAVEVLDRWLAGMPVEQALTNWGRASRFAGSSDRAAVRDLVFDAVRCRDSFAARGGGLTGRGLVLGGLREAGADVAALFTGDRHAPGPLRPEEPDPGPSATLPRDVPAAVAPMLRDSLGPRFAGVMERLRHRAPLFLRVCLARTTLDAVQARLAAEGISARPVDGVKTALEITGNERKVASSPVLAEGLVEVQDAASQAAVAMLPLRDGDRVLDYCAGGGGKTLAMADRARLDLFAHDAAPQRMADLPRRAARAGVQVALLPPEAAGSRAPYDLVLLDVPCSGSGAWRRAPETKWTLSPAAVVAMAARQADLLDAAVSLVAPGGHLAYLTCALLAEENEAQRAAFLDRTPGWQVVAERRFWPGEPGDGFFATILTRSR